jgi:hypothetical protein
VLDGNKVIHAITATLPYARVNQARSGDPVWWGLDRDAPREHSAANYRAKDAIYEQGKKWLEKNRPGGNDVRDPLKGWSL